MVVVFHTMNPASVTADPPADRVENGNPQATLRLFHESPDGRVSAGTWTCSPGSWRVAYDETEYCRITEGKGALLDTDGRSIPLSAGDEFVIPAGFRGVWKVTDTMTKTWVVILP